MKLSKNNKIYISNAFKDKKNFTDYGETKAASICLYNSEIVLNLTLEELNSFDIEVDELEDFSIFRELFTNSKNHKKLLNKIVIKSDNPFITSMLNMNRVSKNKYFVELICLNKIELKDEFEFFNELFEKIHWTNFLFLYKTNNIQEFAEVRFTLNLLDLFQKTFTISKKNQLKKKKERENTHIDRVKQNNYSYNNNDNNNNNIKIEILDKEKFIHNKLEKDLENFSPLRGTNNLNNFHEKGNYEKLNENLNHFRKRSLGSNSGMNKENEQNLSKISSKNEKLKDNKRNLSNQEIEKSIDNEEYNSAIVENNFLYELEEIQKKTEKIFPSNNNNNVEFNIEGNNFKQNIELIENNENTNKNNSKIRLNIEEYYNGKEKNKINEIDNEEEYKTSNNKSEEKKIISVNENKKIIYKQSIDETTEKEKKFFYSSMDSNFFINRKNNPKDKIYELDFNIGNYNYIYIDFGYSLKENNKSSFENMSLFIKWAWENFKNLKFVLYFPNISDFHLDLNIDLLNDVIEIFSIADILLFEKRELLTYIKNIYDVTQGNIKQDIYNQNVNINSDSININYNSIKTCKNKFDWEEFFIKDLKIKKRGMPMITYPTKILVIFDEMNKIFIFEKNFDNKIISKNEDNFTLYPQINHTNQRIIEFYRKCVIDNYLELRGIYFGGFLSKIMQKPVKMENNIISRDYTGAYMISLELAKRFLRIIFYKKEYPYKKEFYTIKLDIVTATSKLSEDLHKRRESKFILDCVNQKKSYLKFYQPLNDYSLKEFFKGKSVSCALKSHGFTKNDRGQLLEPKTIRIVDKKEESLKIDWKKFYEKEKYNTNNNNYFYENSNVNSLGKTTERLSIKNINSNSSSVSNNNLAFSGTNFNKTAKTSVNSFNNNLKFSNTGFKTSYANKEKFNNFSEKFFSPERNFNTKSNANFGNTISIFPNGKDIDKYGSKSKLNEFYNKNDNMTFPKLFNEEKKLMDHKEQVKNYFEFEKKLLIN
jgi:hypothetical protein